MPVCGQRGCSCSPIRKSRPRRKSTPEERYARASSTRERLVHRLKVIAKADIDRWGARPYPNVSLERVPVRGREWEVLTLNNRKVTVRVCNGSVFLLVEARVTGDKEKHFPIPKRARGWVAVRRLYAEIVDGEALEEARLFAVALQERKAVEMRAAERALQEARVAAQQATQAEFDALVREFKLPGMQFYANEFGQATRVTIDQRVTPAQVRKVFEMLMPLIRTALTTSASER